MAHICWSFHRVDSFLIKKKLFKFSSEAILTNLFCLKCFKNYDIRLACKNFLTLLITGMFLTKHWKQLNDQYHKKSYA